MGEEGKRRRKVKEDKEEGKERSRKGRDGKGEEELRKGEKETECRVKCFRAVRGEWTPGNSLTPRRTNFAASISRN